MHLNKYKTLVFDCDGVILDSNKVKTGAFYQAALSYGCGAADTLVQYHVANGGVSRYKKFTYFLEEIVRQPSEKALNELLHIYAASVRKGLLSCAVAPGLKKLRGQTINIPWIIVSGGDQDELRDIFSQRGIIEWFDGGIFGSPDSKEDILARESAKLNIQTPALFLGDSKYDHVAAQSAGLDFVFISDWSEVKDWEHWVREDELTVASSLGDLLGR